MNTPSQADMSQGINPAFLSGGYGGGGANGAPQGLTPQQIQQMQAMRGMGGQGGQGGQGMGINPAMFQQGGGGGGGMNPAALMNGMGGAGGMGGMGGGMNGRMAQIQQMQLQAQAQRANMMGGGGMGGGGMGMGGGMGLNPSQLLQQQQQQQMNSMGGMGGGGMNGMGGMNPGALGGGMNGMGGNMGGMANMNMGGMGGMNMGGMGGMNMAGMGLGMGGSSMTSPTSSSAALPNVSGHGMSQQSPSAGSPPNNGLPPGFPNLTPLQMQHLAQMNPQMKAMQIQRIMQAQMANSGGMQGMSGGGMQGMGMGGMSGMTPAQLQQMQMLQQQQQQQNQGHMQRPPSSASFGGPHGPRLSQGQIQAPSTPGPGSSGAPHSGGMSHGPQQAGVMGPPSSIPPRPPTSTSHHGHGGMHPHMQQQQQQAQQQQGFPHGAPYPSQSPRPGTAGSRPGTAQSQPQSQSASGQDGPAAPMPVPHGSLSHNVAGTPQRPGTSQSMGAPEKLPSRPPTASGHGPPQTPRQQAQQIPQQQQPQHQQQHTRMSPTQQAGSGSGYTPIAPAPVPAGVQAPGVRRSSETPAPVSAPTPPQMARSQSQTGIVGMGITGNVGPAPGAMQAQPQPPASAGASSLMGGAGGGMMPPPVIPRSTHGHAGAPEAPVGGGGMNVNMSMTMNMGGVPGMMGRPMAVPQGQQQQQQQQQQNQSLNVNTNLMPPGAGAMQSPAAVGGAMAAPANNANASNMAGVGLALDSGSSASVPPTPARGGSLPPTAGSPSVAGPVPGMLGGVPAKTPVAAAAATANVKPAASPAPAPTPVTVTKIVPQLPSLPKDVQMDPKVTRVSVVPLVESEKAIPPLGEDEIKAVQGWMQADKEYEARYRKMRERVGEEMKKTVSAPRAWWEKDFSLAGPEETQARKRRGEKWMLTGLKSQKEREMKDKKRAGKREGLRLPRRISDEDAQRPEQLVPIRLEFDVEHHKMRDTFVWNLNDPIVTPEIFAQSVVDDYGLAPSYHAIITKSIQEQLSDYKAHSATFGEDGVMIDEAEDILSGKFTEEETAWWEAWRKRVRSKALYKLPNPPDPRTRKRRKVVKEEPAQPVAPGGEVLMAVDDFEEDENLMHEEMRILVKVDVIVGSVKLEDQFEWDLENVDPTPEQFAEIYCQDLGLGGEFKTAIAHAIREQVQIYQKSLFLVGHPSDGSAVQDDDLRMSLLPSLTSGARSMEQVSAFTPQLNYLSESELEKNEKDREKELARRKRKTTRGRRGVALPDREPPKTFRTPAIGFPEISPAALALAAAAAAPTSRRAAAAAASLTIANMVASENGTVVMPQTPSLPITPVAPTPSTKEKKPKGLFKAPSYPPTVLRPRANVKAPTPSTAADLANVPPPIENDLPLPSSSGIDRQGSKVVLTAKRAKELEREAKEKEYADGQHANYIDGVWHCSNCGCPETIAIGRRKGPLGDKSQCGTCGKYWHRHRRPRPVTYNSSLEYHQGLQRAEEMQKSAAKRKRPHSAVVEVKPQIPDDDDDVGTPAPSKPKSKAGSIVPDGVGDAPDRAVSPVSTASSASESPLAQRVKMNGAHSKSAPPAHPDSDVKSEPTQAPPQASPPRPAPSAPPTQHPPLAVPQWMTEAMHAMHAKYPDDIFEVVTRKNTSGEYDLRIKCTDCPGKHYTPGPGESLTNFEVHLKNRQHRAKVNARLHPPADS